MNKLLCLIRPLTLLAVSANATNYYVSSSSGNDTNNGTSPATPWKTIARANSANSQFVAGDTIFLKRGEIFDGYLNTINRNGTAANPIVYTSYGSALLPVSGLRRKLPAGPYTTEKSGRLQPPG